MLLGDYSVYPQESTTGVSFTSRFPNYFIHEGYCLCFSINFLTIAEIYSFFPCLAAKMMYAVIIPGYIQYTVP